MANRRYRKHLATTQAGAVIVDKTVTDYKGNVLISHNPLYTFSQVACYFAPTKAEDIGVQPSAVVAQTAVVAHTASVGANAVIGENTTIGEHTKIGAGCVIGHNVTIGAHCCLHANVTLYDGVSLGDRVSIHAGTVVGSDGFGYASEKGQWHKIPQLGSVRIDDNVEIGANTCIDCGAIEDTHIKAGVIIDNQVQIAHNVVIGENTAIAGCTGIAGSTTLGKNCLVGASAGFAGHITVADNVTVTGNAMVSNSIKTAGIYSSGTGLQPNRQWHKSVARFHQLDKLARDIKQLQKERAHD